MFQDEIIRQFEEQTGEELNVESQFNYDFSSNSLIKTTRAKTKLASQMHIDNFIGNK